MDRVATSSGAEEIRERIRSFRNLPDGWHYGEGCAASGETENIALELHSAAVIAGLMRTGAFPGIDGEIRVTIYHENIYLEFTVETDGMITYVREDSRRLTAHKSNLALEDALSTLRDSAREIWDSYGSYITGTTIGIITVFNPSHLEIPKIRMAFR